MRRPVLVISAVLAMVVAASGCSAREVQLWFQVNRHQSITVDQATSLANAINAKRAPGCDSNYAGPASWSTKCVPDNATDVHCAGTAGPGASVNGPLLITGWDSFGLDPDGDKYACVDPVSRLDTFGQVLDHIEIDGWTYDPDAPAQSNVDVYDNNVGTRTSVAGQRPDLVPLFGSQALHSGFQIDDPADIGTTHQVCAYSINAGFGANQLMACKTLTMADVGEVTWNGDDVFGMIEGADAVPGGIRVRGFVVDDDNPGTVPTVGVSPSTTGLPIFDITSNVKLQRSDVADQFEEPSGNAYGFDFVINTQHQTQFAGATQVCLYDGTPLLDGKLMCRTIGS